MAKIFSEDIVNLNGLSTERFCCLMESFFALFGGFALACIYSWKVALISLVLLPVVVLGYVMNKVSINADAKTNKGQNSDEFMTDLILNFKTIKSFGERSIDDIIARYQNMLEQTTSGKQAHLTGLAYGYSLGVRFLYIGIVFYIGAVFMVEYQIEYKNVFIAVFVVLVSSLGAGMNLSNVQSKEVA